MSPVGMDDRQLSVVEREALGECFDSAEARYEYEKALRLRRVLKWVGGLLALVVFGVFMYRLGGGGRRQAAGDSDQHNDAHGGPQGKVSIEPVGSADAKVKVLAILPVGSDCHNGVVKFLSETAGKRQDQIRVEFTTMDAYGQKKLEKDVGTSCAAVMINRKTSFEVSCGGKPRTISLVGTEPTHYSIADIGEALTSVFVGEYGDPGQPIYEAPASNASCSGPGGEGGHSHGGVMPPKGSRGVPEEKAEPLELPDFREIKTTP